MPRYSGRFYAAGLSVIDTCRKRGIDPWAYGRDLIAAARKGSSFPSIPAKLAASNGINGYSAEGGLVVESSPRRSASECANS